MTLNRVELRAPIRALTPDEIDAVVGGYGEQEAIDAYNDRIEALYDADAYYVPFGNAGPSGGFGTSNLQEHDMGGGWYQWEYTFWRDGYLVHDLGYYYRGYTS